MRPIGRQGRRVHLARLWTRLLVVGALALAAVAVGAGPAVAAPSVSVGITQIGAGTQASGNTFTYDVGFQCSSVEAAPCDDTQITIPLGDAAAFSPQVVAGSPWVDSWNVDGDGNLVITLVSPLPAGTSGTIPINLKPPNNTTEDGTTWILAPTISSSTAGSEGTPPPGFAASVDSTATAQVHNTISKDLVGNAYRQPGDLVTFRIAVACRQTSTGNLFAESMQVTDRLPAGLTYVSSDPAGAPSGNGVTWTLPGAADLPASCTQAGSTGTATVTVTARVDAGVADGTVVTNQASSTTTGLGGSAGSVVRDSASITVVDDIAAHPGNFSKASFGQLADSSAAPGGQEGNSHTTFPGNWSGYLAAQPGNVLRNYTPNADTGMVQAGYKMRYTNIANGLGYQVSLRDPMPCYDHNGDAIQPSRPVAQAPCAQNDLAFHPTTVSVWVHNNAQYDYGPAISADYAPTAVVASTGQRITLTQTGTTADFYRNFAVPAQYVGDVAEIDFPRDAGLASDDIRYAVFGYADQATVKGDILRNIAHADIYAGDAAAPAKSTEDQADIYLTDEPQTGIQKSFNVSQPTPGGTVRMHLDGFLRTSGEASQDLVMADLLPVGMTWPGATSTVQVTGQVTYRPEGATSSVQESVPFTLTATVIDNYGGSGRQLVRLTLPVDQLTPFGQMQLTVPLDLSLKAPPTPGIYDNAANVFYDNADLSTSCAQSPPRAQNASDPYDLDGNGSATDRNCQSDATVRVVAPQGSAGFAASKTVQGDDDTSPKSPPAIGQVDPDGGTATFGLNWSNTGAAPLNHVILYDVFPHVGDTGVSGSQATVPRGSQFDAVFVGLGTPLPAGLTVAYTTSTDPCRPEVYPAQDQSTCGDDWTTTPPADLASVTGIRVTSSRTYQTGEGFHLDVHMTTPKIEPGQVAWNSFASDATNANTGNALPPSGVPKVGITAKGEALPPVITKTVDKQDATPGDDLTYTLTLTNPGDSPLTDVTATDTLPAGLRFVSATPATTVDGQALTWSGLEIDPYQTITLTVVAQVRPGFTGALTNAFTSPGAIVPDGCEADVPDPTHTACATTLVDPAQLTVHKAVTGDGASFARGPYEARVVCVADDSTVVDQLVDLDGDGASTTVDVPYGSTCTVTEPGDGGATGTTVTPTQPVAITAGTPTYDVTVTNRFAAGQLVIAKDLTGVGSAFGTGPFRFHAACAFQDRTVLDREVTIDRDGDATTLVSDPLGPLPVGASCTVTELAGSGADATPPPVTVRIAEDATTDNTVTATFVNAYSAGTVGVHKVVTGRAAASHRDQTFTVRVTCEVPLAGGGSGTVYEGSVAVRAGRTTPVTDSSGVRVLLPLGAHCFGHETNDGGATSSSVDHGSYADAAVVSSGSPDELQHLTITATNRFDPRRTTTSATGSGGQVSGLLANTGAPQGLAALALLGLVLTGLGLTLARRTARRRP